MALTDSDVQKQVMLNSTAFLLLECLSMRARNDFLTDQANDGFH